MSQLGGRIFKARRARTIGPAAAARWRSRRLPEDGQARDGLAITPFGAVNLGIEDSEGQKRDYHRP